MILPGENKVVTVEYESVTSVYIYTACILDENYLKSHKRNMNIIDILFIQKIK